MFAVVTLPLRLTPARTARWLLGLTLIFFQYARVSAQPADDPSVEETPAANLDYDFRGGKPLPPGFYLAGAVQDLTVRPEEAGLRLTLSGTRPNPLGRAGLEMRTTLRGDFSITAGYEILQADPPTQGHGVGFELYAHTGPKLQQGLGAYRMARRDQGEIYLLSRSFLNEAGKTAWRSKHVPTEVKSGRLRITRTGTQATVWAADGPAALFKEVGSDDLGNDAIKVIWLMAYTGHAPRALDLRLTDLSIRLADPIPNAPLAQAPLPARPPRPHLWWAVGTMLVLLALALVIVWRSMVRHAS